MSKYNRLGIAIIAAMLLAATWLNFGLAIAVGVTFVVVSYFFVLAMRSAAEEIKQYERDQRPDLHTADR